MLSSDFKLVGDVALAAKLSDLSKAIDEEAILDEAAAILLNRIRTRFLDESGPDGKWPESAAGRKRKAAGGPGTLYRTGRLFHSIQLFDTGPNRRLIGTDVEYAPKHQLGLEGMPVRAFIGINEEDLSVVHKLVLRRVQEVL